MLTVNKMILIMATFATMCSVGCTNERPTPSRATAEKAALNIQIIEEEETTKAKEEAIENKENEETNAADESENRATNERLSKAAGQAKIHFEDEVYSFGEVMAGDVVKHSFTFKNMGKSDLVITDASATCGCTRPDFPFLPIAPGEEGTINVTFNTTGKFGAQKKPITIYSNGTPKVKRVYLEGNVVERSTEKPTFYADEAEPDSLGNQ